MGGRRRAAVGVPLGLAVLAACGVAYRKSLSPSAAAASLLAAAPGGASFRQQALDASGDALEMECSNEDTAHYGQPGRGYPWLTVGHLVEPHRETTITLVGGAAMAVEAVDWTVAQTTNIAEHKGAQRVRTSHVGGRGMVFTPLHLGNYDVSALVNLTGGVRTTVSRTLVSRYVRRSIRAMSGANRDKFFAAAHVLATTDYSVGLALYGDDFNTITNFTKIHLNNAGTRNTDHLHDGLGFLTQHAAMTMAFERSLRSVDAAISVPYWDFTYDAESFLTGSNFTTNDPALLWTLDVWGEDWFGNASGSKYHTIETGRWAWQKVAVVDHEDPAIHNAYGLLRAPWNTNKSPFLTRAHSMCAHETFSLTDWPSCEEHYTLAFAYASWYEWGWAVQYTPHGAVHKMVGGYVNCGDLVERAKGFLPPSAVGQFAESLVEIPKNLWRSYLVEYPDYCSEDTPQDQCHVQCDYSTGKIGKDEWTAAAYEGDDPTWIRNLSHKEWNDFYELYCDTPMAPGEQLESASPADISFWPIHPTLERLLIYTRLVHKFSDASWPEGDADDAICLYTETDCRGHNAYDVTSFESHVMGSDGTFEYAYLTNAEIFDLNAPGNYSLDYVYDNFEWSHCDDTPFAFPKLDDAQSISETAKSVQPRTHKPRARKLARKPAAQP